MEWSYIANTLIMAGIACIAALGLYVTISTGQLSVGHAAFFGVGAYGAGILTANGVDFWVALPVGMAVSGLIGLLVSVLMLRLHHWFLSIATLGMGEFLRVVALNSQWLGGARGLSGVPLKTTVGLVYVALALTLFLVWRLEGSRVGYAYRLVRHDDVVAAALGVNVRRVRIASFTLGSIIAGLAGILYIHYIGIIEPKSLGFQHSLDFLIYVAVGGVNTVWGPVLGAFTLSILPEFLRFSLYDRYLLLGGILAVIIILMPQGILSRQMWTGRPTILERLLGSLWPTYGTLYAAGARSKESAKGAAQ